MSCPNFVMDEDGERICDCGDEGRLCAKCAEAEAAYWLSEYRRARMSEIDPEAYAEDMRDAGRGHLLRQ